MHINTYMAVVAQNRGPARPILRLIHWMTPQLALGGWGHVLTGTQAWCKSHRNHFGAEFLHKTENI